MLGRVGDCVRAVQSLIRVRVFLESKSLMSVCGVFLIFKMACAVELYKTSLSKRFVSSSSLSLLTCEATTFDDIFCIKNRKTCFISGK